MLDKLRLRFQNRQREWERDFARELAKFSKEMLMRGENDDSDGPDDTIPNTTYPNSSGPSSQL